MIVIHSCFPLRNTCSCCLPYKCTSTTYRRKSCTHSVVVSVAVLARASASTTLKTASKNLKINWFSWTILQSLHICRKMKCGNVLTHSPLGTLSALSFFTLQLRHLQVPAKSISLEAFRNNSEMLRMYLDLKMCFLAAKSRIKTCLRQMGC